jgi:dihydropteroate synthase
LAAKDTAFHIQKTLNIRGKILELSTPKVMGVINITSDSFYANSRSATESDALRLAENHMNNGADMLDIGAYSSRPGAAHISEEEEMERLLPSVQAIASRYPSVPISVDTFRARIARAAVDCGAGMINDISGGTLDQDMFATIARLNVPYVLMHMRGTPQSMAGLHDYDNLMEEVIRPLTERLDFLIKMGVKDVIVDVGLGFAKKATQSFELLNHLKYFQSLNRPLLVGLSRKSMIYKTLRTSPEEALNGTSVLHALALERGGDILRVHDTKEAKETVRLWKKLKTQTVE